MHVVLGCSEAIIYGSRPQRLLAAISWEPFYCLHIGPHFNVRCRRHCDTHYWQPTGTGTAHKTLVYSSKNYVIEDKLWSILNLWRCRLNNKTLTKFQALKTRQRFTLFWHEPAMFPLHVFLKRSPKVPVNQNRVFAVTGAADDLKPLFTEMGKNAPPALWFL